MASNATQSGASAVPEKSSREVSTIAFPYMDMEEGIKVARQLHEYGGGVPLERDQVSAALNSAGGTLANKLSASKQFGFIDSQQGKWSLTDLGYKVLDGATERAARAEAFLNVELYRRAFDEFRGKPLPGKLGLEKAFTSFGVAHKQKEKARQTFERSARFAGYFPTPTEDRLVQPVLGASIAATPSPVAHLAAFDNSQSPVATRPAQNSDSGQLDGVMAALIAKLPASGSPFPPEDRKKWLTMMEMAMEMAYASNEAQGADVG